MSKESSATFVDLRATPARENDVWPVAIMRGADIERELMRLSDGEVGADGRRESLVVHPRSGQPGRGLSPGMDVTFGVLNPGQSTRPRRRNAVDLSMGLSGRGRITVGTKTHDIGARDVWTTPTMLPLTIENRGDDPFTYVVYSNAPLLQKLEISFEEFNPPLPRTDTGAVVGSPSDASGAQRSKDLSPPIPLRDGGGQLMTYEHLVDPDFTPSQPIMWHWSEVEEHADQVRSLGTKYSGRPLFCLYNPATGDRNGTTSTMFATFAFYPPEKVDTPHRHSSAAINYILDGSGWSIVNGERVEWSAGDIMLSAPGWGPHGHASGPGGTTILTVQDHPLQLGIDSLIWQENLTDAPIVSLGTDFGFQTNLAEVASAR